MNEEITGFSGNSRSSSPLPPEALARAPENADVIDIENENSTTKQSYMAGGLCLTGTLFDDNNTGQFVSRSVKFEMLNFTSQNRVVNLPLRVATEGLQSAEEPLAELPPLEGISTTTAYSFTSPLTQPSIEGTRQSVRNDQESVEQQQNIEPNESIFGVSYDVTDEGVHISVPVYNMPSLAPQGSNYFDFQEGYDSNGECGPFFDAVEDDDDKSEDDDELPPGNESSTNNEPMLEPAIELAEADIKRMTNNELKAELKKRNLSQNGKTEILQQRLLSNLIIIDDIVEKEDDEDEPNLYLPPTARWIELEYTALTEEPARPPKPRGATVPRDEEEFKKFNFERTFDHAPFTGMAPERKIVHGKIVKDRKGKEVMEQTIRKQGRANPEFLKKHKLTEFSQPQEWFSSLLPDKRQPNDSKHIISIADWTSYTNKKALIANAGQEGGMYPDFKPFSPKWIKQFIGLYILHGLSPSPQVKMKFKPQHEDPINGNDLCAEVFGSNGGKEHKYFKAFFGCQDPMLPLPQKKLTQISSLTVS